MEAALFFGMLLLGGLVLLPIIALVSSSKLSRRMTQAEQTRASLARTSTRCGASSAPRLSAPTGSISG